MSITFNYYTYNLLENYVIHFLRNQDYLTSKENKSTTL